MYVTMDVTLSESEYFYTPVFSPSNPKGESVICDLDAAFGWLDVQDVRPSGGDDNTPLIVAEEICMESPCDAGVVQPTATEAELASPQASAEASNHEIYAEASPLSLARSCHRLIRLL
ncbi:hypothetical protein D8674_033709 [Pyrus ussuriensis x Pyrus communis]|uniref:Uncharacterized protein n=1 Tax=Pyrus ussuriensis x Pyrus communis TaxID=2448454 RepID=A0A5N5HZU8_9ROSA|nr:hypothetical protein D8674_033709 [Pyrus ussuriensis x Pyrus communis]